MAKQAGCQPPQGWVNQIACAAGNSTNLPVRPAVGGALSRSPPLPLWAVAFWLSACPES
jgi:hypothetical protein